VKYELEYSVIFDSNTFHATSVLSYESGYRLCLLVLVANITPRTAVAVLDDIPVGFPCKDDSDVLLEWANKSPHWKCNRNRVSVNIPSVPDEVIFGDKWIRMFNIVASVVHESGTIHSIGDDQRSNHAVRQWVSDQRYYYSVKHGIITVNRSQLKFGRLLSDAREAKLKSIGFIFQCPRGGGVSQFRWLKNFEELKSFYEKHGHSNVMPSHNVSQQLVTWVRMQRRSLRGANVSGNEIVKDRVRLLKSIKFKFRIHDK
jgi:hypothetical protein